MDKAYRWILTVWAVWVALAAIFNVLSQMDLLRIIAIVAANILIFMVLGSPPPRLKCAYCGVKTSPNRPVKPRTFKNLNCTELDVPLCWECHNR